MISAFANCLKVPELRQRIFFTLAIIVVVRLGAAVTLPGVDSINLQKYVDASLEAQNATSGAAAINALLTMFSGGGLQNCAIFALGIMPYISASIMLQLGTAVIPQLGKLSREDGGRQKITQYTRIVTIILALFQGFMLVRSLENPSTNPFLSGYSVEEFGPLVPDPDFWFYLVAVTTIVGGTMLLMWLGEQVTERGIGNGISLIIAINIISALPGALVILWNTYLKPAEGMEFNPFDPALLVLLIVFLVAVVAAVIAITEAQRRITIQYAKRVVGRKVYGGQTQYMPLKVNYSGVMPIIFAQAIVVFPAQILGMVARNADWTQSLQFHLSPASWVYYVVSALLIFFFSYFWVATMFQPTQIADDLKKNGGYIPGVRPGKPTADFLDFTMGRLTFAGALFLTLIYALPAALNYVMGVPYLAGQLFGGTSILILVGVVLDIMRQIETHLLQKNYDGFLRKGKIRGRFERKQASGQAASSRTLITLWVTIAILSIFGMVAYLAN
ncbi:MAG: preprotein translocase subunit SecY [Verrucomicrobiota bacterium]